MHKYIVHLVGINDTYSSDISSHTLHGQQFRWIILSGTQLMKTDDMLSSKNRVLSIGR